MADRLQAKKTKGRGATKRELLEQLEQHRKHIADLERIVEGLRGTEKVLVESEEHSRSLFERMPLPYHLLGVDGRVIAANDLWLALFGYSREEVVGGCFSDFLSSEQRTEFGSWLRSVASGEKTEEIRVEIRKSDGAYADVEIRAVRDYIESMGVMQIHCLLLDISEQQRLIDALRHGEDRYRSTVDSITDALHVVDRDLRIVLMNRPLLEWHEKLSLPTDVIGKRLQDIYVFLPPEVEGEYRKVFETGKPLITEETTRVGEADIVTEARKIPVFEDGNVAKVITIIRDITDRKRMEDALRQSEANFKTLAEQSPNMIFVNMKGRIVYINRKFIETMGYTREEFYSPAFDFFCLIAPESIESVAETYAAYMEGRKQHSHEWTLVTRSGRKMECIVMFAVVGYGKGEALLGVVTDITARKRAEEALRASEEKYRSFVEDFHGIAYRGGVDGTPIFFHGGVERITGYSEEDFLGGVPKWIDIVLAEDRSEFEGGFPQEGRFAADRILELEYRIRRRDGRIRWIHQSVKPVLDPSGAVLYLQGALYDVTERRVAEHTIARERSALGIIAEAATKSRNVTEVCERVLSGLAATLGFDCGTIRLYDADARVLRFTATHGLDPAEIRQHVHDQHIDDREYIAALVGRTRKPIWAPDVSACDDLKEYRQRLAEVRMRSIISWPLISPKGTLVGVMHLLGRKPISIPEEARDFFRTVSDMFVVVLDRKRAEEAVQLSEAMYKSRFESSPIGLWEEDFTDVKRLIDSLRESGIEDFEAYFREHPEVVMKCAEAVKFRAANRAALDLYDVTTIEEFARVSETNIRTYTLDTFRKALTLVASGATEFDLDYQTRTSHGDKRLVRLRWSAAPGCEHSLERVLVSAMDLTDRKEAGVLESPVDLTDRKEAEETARRAELQLRLYSKELEEMVRDKTSRIRELERQRAETEKLAATGRMAARIAHEINNPLAGIKNSFLLLRDIMDKEHPHYEYAELVQREIDRIARIIRRMFDLYRPDVTERQEVRVDEVVRDVTGIMEGSFRACGVEIAVELCETPVSAALPVGYFNQVLFNLVQNALEASGAGDTVTIGLESKRDALIVEVRDQGHGIPDNLKGKIFEPFFTTKSDAEGKGLGLGLPVSKGMVEAMGGTITICGNSPRGTIFTVVLPLHRLAKEV